MTPRSQPRAFLLVSSLLLALILLVTGMGLMAAQSSRYAQAAQVSAEAQAENAALSGFEDVKVKLASDVEFPPNAGDDPNQNQFSYGEVLVDNGTQPVVSYSVVVDYAMQREAEQPVTAYEESLPYRWGLYRVTVTGYVGPQEDPIAKRVFYAEYDITAGRFIRFDDQEAL